MQKFFTSLAALIGYFGIYASPANVSAEPVVPGYSVSIYATVPHPLRLAFDPLGILYVGNSDNSSGGAFIHRVSAGGTVVDTYGSAIYDPDTVVVDVTGVVSGVAGAVLVGGEALGSLPRGLITAIRPDQTQFQLFGPTSTFRNPDDLSIDNTGRLVFTDFGDGDPTKQAVFVSSGLGPALLFVEAGGAIPGSLAIDSTNRIFTAGSDGTIRIHDAFGALVSGNFATNLGPDPGIAFGRGGTFGTGLFALNHSDGTLLRIDAVGNITQIGSMFDTDSSTIAFGPDGALYVSQTDHNRILRIAAIPEPSAIWLLGIGLFILISLFRARVGWANGSSVCPRERCQP